MQMTNANANLPLALSLFIVVVQLYTISKLAAVSCAKIVLYLQSILYNVCFKYNGPTSIYEDDASTILIVNSGVPTERSQHIYVQYFTFKNWKEWGSIKLIHIPWILNPSDDLTKPLE